MTIEEIREATGDGGAFTVAGWGAGIAWRFAGAETKPDADTEWTGIEEPTGMVTMVMVGDDREFSIDPDDVGTLEEGEFCRECGQVGCGHG